MNWSNACTKFQNCVKRLLTFRKVFWCDSHVNLCVTCKRIRDFIRTRQRTNLLMIKTQHTTYIWTSLKHLKVVVSHG